ncbi:MAG: hypothetical protein V1742_07805 [Pseudomonadota bacterium]
MPASEPILVTITCKLGYLVYTLPAVRSLARALGRPVCFQTSTYAQAATGLLKAQPYLAGCLIDESYRLEHTMYGCQPYLMREPPGFDRVFHLGFRQELLGPTVLSRHLIETFFYTFKKVYGLDLELYQGEKYIFVDESGQNEHVVFQGHGKSLMDHLKPPERQRLAEFWRYIRGGLGREVVMVTGESERDFYADFEGRVVCPADLLDTARLIASARCFIGVQSAAAAVADGLKVPRLIFHWFNNARPTGPNGLSFTLDADPAEVLAAFKERFGL